MATRPDLLVELRANAPIDLVQVLVGQTYLPDRAVRIEESVVHDASRCSSGEANSLTWLLPRNLLPAVKEVVELSYFLDEGLIVDHVTLSLVNHLLVAIIHGLVGAGGSRLQL